MRTSFPVAFEFLESCSTTSSAVVLGRHGITIPRLSGDAGFPKIVLLIGVKDKNVTATINYRCGILLLLSERIEGFRPELSNSKQRPQSCPNCPFDDVLAPHLVDIGCSPLLISVTQICL